jgi:hypothetical protein
LLVSPIEIESDSGASRRHSEQDFRLGLHVRP